MVLAVPPAAGRALSVLGPCSAYPRQLSSDTGMQELLNLCDIEPRIIEPGLRGIIAHHDLFQPGSGQVQYIYGRILSTRCQRGECYVLRVWRPLDAADLIHGCTEEGLQPLPIAANQLQPRLVLGKSQGDEEDPLSIH